jgi:hypothetical protein
MQQDKKVKSSRQTKAKMVGGKGNENQIMKGANMARLPVKKRHRCVVESDEDEDYQWPCSRIKKSA